MKNLMKFLIITLVISISFSQFGQLYNQWNLREEIFSRYDNGNKKILVKYSGHGSNEIIVERITYSENNNVLLIEKPQEKIKIIKEYYWNESIKYHKEYKSEKLDGEWYNYYDNGQIKNQGNFSKDLKEGEWTYYYENGQLQKQGNYIAGLMDAEWIYYYENGNMKGKGYYINGDGNNLGTLGIPRNGRNGESKANYWALCNFLGWIWST